MLVTFFSIKEKSLFLGSCNIGVPIEFMTVAKKDMFARSLTIFLRRYICLVKLLLMFPLKLAITIISKMRINKMRYNTNITVRLSEEQRRFVEDSAKMLEVSPAKFIRMVLASLMSNWSSQVNKYNNRGNSDED